MAYTNWQQRIVNLENGSIDASQLGLGFSVYNMEIEEDVAIGSDVTLPEGASVNPLLANMLISYMGMILMHGNDYTIKDEHTITTNGEFLRGFSLSFIIFNIVNLNDLAEQPAPAKLQAKSVSIPEIESPVVNNYQEHISHGLVSLNVTAKNAVAISLEVPSLGIDVQKIPVDETGDITFNVSDDVPSGSEITAILTAEDSNGNTASSKVTFTIS